LITLPDPHTIATLTFTCLLPFVAPLRFYLPLPPVFTFLRCSRRLPTVPAALLYWFVRYRGCRWLVVAVVHSCRATFVAPRCALPFMRLPRFTVCLPHCSSLLPHTLPLRYCPFALRARSFSRIPPAFCFERLLPAITALVAAACRYRTVTCWITVRLLRSRLTFCVAFRYRFVDITFRLRGLPTVVLLRRCHTLLRYTHWLRLPLRFLPHRGYHVCRYGFVYDLPHAHWLTRCALRAARLRFGYCLDYLHVYTRYTLLPVYVTCTDCRLPLLYHYATRFTLRWLFYPVWFDLLCPPPYPRLLYRCVRLPVARLLRYVVACVHRFTAFVPCRAYRLRTHGYVCYRCVLRIVPVRVVTTSCCSHVYAFRFTVVCRSFVTCVLPFRDTVDSRFRHPLFYLRTTAGFYPFRYYRCLRLPLPFVPGRRLPAVTTLCASLRSFVGLRLY